MAEIKPGARVLARTSSDRMLNRRAITGIVQGMDFPVVWVCPENEWQAARTDGRPPDALPWPASAVQLDESAESQRLG